MSRLAFFSAFLLCLLFFSCDEDNPSSSSPKQGYLFVTGGYLGTVGANIIAQAYPEKVPSVAVNGQPLKPIIGSYIYWELMGLPATSIVNYSIDSDGDNLEGSFAIPAAITQVTCNGIECIDYYINYEQTPVSVSGSYTFSWSAVNASAFLIDYVYVLEDSTVYEFGKYVTSSSFVISSTGSLPWIDFYVSVCGSPEIVAGSTPNNSSSKAFIYYNISGPRFNADCSISASQPERKKLFSEIDKEKQFKILLDKIPE